MHSQKFLLFLRVSVVKGSLLSFIALIDSYQNLTCPAVWELLISVSRLFTTALPCESLP